MSVDGRMLGLGVALALVAAKALPRGRRDPFRELVANAGVRTGPSPIHGLGLFATAFLPKGRVIGPGLHRVGVRGEEDDLSQTFITRHVNHALPANVFFAPSATRGFTYDLVVIRDARPGDELVANYDDYGRFVVRTAKEARTHGWPTRGSRVRTGLTEPASRDPLQETFFRMAGYSLPAGGVSEAEKVRIRQRGASDLACAYRALQTHPDLEAVWSTDDDNSDTVWMSEEDRRLYEDGKIEILRLQLARRGKDGRILETLASLNGISLNTEDTDYHNTKRLYEAEMALENGLGKEGSPVVFLLEAEGSTVRTNLSPPLAFEPGTRITSVAMFEALPVWTSFADDGGGIYLKIGPDEFRMGKMPPAFSTENFKSEAGGGHLWVSAGLPDVVAHWKAEKAKKGSAVRTTLHTPVKGPRWSAPPPDPSRWEYDPVKTPDGQIRSQAWRWRGPPRVTVFSIPGRTGKPPYRSQLTAGEGTIPVYNLTAQSDGSARFVKASGGTFKGEDHLFLTAEKAMAAAVVAAWTWISERKASDAKGSPVRTTLVSPAFQGRIVEGPLAFQRTPQMIPTGHRFLVHGQTGDAKPLMFGGGVYGELVDPEHPRKPGGRFTQYWWRFERNPDWNDLDLRSTMGFLDLFDLSVVPEVWRKLSAREKLEVENSSSTDMFHLLALGRSKDIHDRVSLAQDIVAVYGSSKFQKVPQAYSTGNVVARDLPELERLLVGRKS